MALSIKTAEHESPGLPTVNKDLTRSGNACVSPDAHSIESPLLDSPFVATPTLLHHTTRAPLIRQADEPFDPTWTNDYLSPSLTSPQALLQPPESPKTSGPESRSLLQLLDSKVTWSENSDAMAAPYQEIEPEIRHTPPGVGGWFRTFGRWFGHSKQATCVVPEVRIELADMPVDEFPIIPHTSGEYKPPWLSLAPLRPPGQSIVATLDFSAFDRIAEGPLSEESKEDSSY